MISLRPPNLALTSFADNLGYEFSMWATWKLPKDATPKVVMNWILHACKVSPEMRLNHIVLNMHGKDGHIYVGEDANGRGVTINNYNVGVVEDLRKADIGTIWILACELAKSGIGRYLCAEIAKRAGCDVVAANVTQAAWNKTLGAIFMPRNHIDDFEGTIYRWSASGKEEVFNPNGGSF